LPVLAVAAIALAGTAYATTPDHHPGGHVRTIELVETSDTPKLTFVDLDKPGLGPGDHVVTTDQVASPDGTPAGGMSQECTLIEPGTNLITSTYECSGSLTLDDGTITNSGPFVPAQPDQAVAVTGGTGEFATARGQVTIRAEQDRITVKLAR
jgi:allene oxide cyclase-like protein